MRTGTLLRVLALGGVLLAGTATAAEVTLRLHHFVSPMAPPHTQFFEPWAEKVMEESDGRIAIEIYPAMQLGGAPPGLYDQVRDGVADMVWTLTGYTPGEFPLSEVWDLPFMPTTGEATSRAAYAFYEQYLQDEFADVKVLAFHVHSPGLLHMRDRAVTGLGDLEGLRVRAPTRVLNQVIDMLGAEPVGMPVTDAAEALSRGVIDSTILPWEITYPFRIVEMVNYHATFADADRGLYTTPFVFAMNRDRYESLPADLREVIDRNSGMEQSAALGRVIDGGDLPALKMALERGNEIHRFDNSDMRAWMQVLQPVYDQWVERTDAMGLDGESMLEDARALVEEHSRGVDMADLHERAEAETGMD